jgi:hypothetical protein
MTSKEADNSNVNVICDVVTPFKVATGGGDHAKVAVLFSSTYYDRDDLERTLEKLLKRTSVSNGGSLPPTHVVLVSALGTTRTDKMPYNMQNLMGRKLSKKQSMEESLMGRCRQGLSGGQIPLDYTVVKWGAIKPDGSIAKGKSNDSNVNGDVNANLQYGDSLDGDIEVSDAAQVLYQSIAMQKYAHNSIFSAVTSAASSSITSSSQLQSQLQQPQWDDLFLRLDGPELQRFDISTGSTQVKADADADAADAEAEALQKKYALLCEYVIGWAEQFQAGSGKNVGLSTPVTVSKTASNAVQIKFKSTNTGASYRSAKEERTMEQAKNKQQQRGAGEEAPAPAPAPTSRVVGKAKKEGGVEIVVEMHKLDNSDSNTGTSGSGSGYGLRVRAKRCNLQEDGTTTIKEMSEETILNKLGSALKYWTDM